MLLEAPVMMGVVVAGGGRRGGDPPDVSPSLINERCIRGRLGAQVRVGVDDQKRARQSGADDHPAAEDQAEGAKGRSVEEGIRAATVPTEAGGGLDDVLGDAVAV